MKTLSFIFLFSLIFSCDSPAQKKEHKSGQEKEFTITKSDAEWKAALTPMQYNVMRRGGTERAFSSPLDKHYESGTYVCAACKTPLYESENKFDSGTGWPSFDRVIEGNVAFEKGGNAYMGIEEHCATCGSHLGHVFNDGPKATTGKRHCINGVALEFVPRK
ncbi:peptide-methionine (R)-S-oxide reductase MsrB [Gelidibacter sp.]|uniref:peptide-methionine (R)-S-oxide reductase MsrB n=1 Tax=Gelidibacter sp. TaxID=2018083 RepID=UPI002C80A406|nr:peptide-methionine (R)-S-oxide reductase MsrB [Gelidibacter sp.]HUH28452.1 peptide-methionine (R)-S-oxide reductase MsrB [Gelidibacter sp.]